MIVYTFLMWYISPLVPIHNITYSPVVVRAPNAAARRTRHSWFSLCRFWPRRRRRSTNTTYTFRPRWSPGPAQRCHLGTPVQRRCLIFCFPCAVCCLPHRLAVTSTAGVLDATSLGGSASAGTVGRWLAKVERLWRRLRRWTPSGRWTAGTLWDPSMRYRCRVFVCYASAVLSEATIYIDNVGPLPRHRYICIPNIIYFI